MTEEDIGLADKARHAFRALGAEQQAHIYRRVASREHKNHFFANLFEKLHIVGFSRPHLASSWLGKYPQQRIETYLLSPAGEGRFKAFLVEFFVFAHQQMNERFLELLNADSEGRCMKAGGRSLAKVGEEANGDAYWPLYEASMQWFILPDLPEKASADEVEEALDSTKTPATLPEQSRNLAARADNRPATLMEELSFSETRSAAHVEAKTNERVAPRLPLPNPGSELTSSFSAADSKKLNQLLRDIEVLSKQATELRVADLAVVTKRLQAALNPLPDLEAQMLGLSGRLAKKIAQLANIEWLVGFKIADPVELQKQSVVKHELNRLQGLDAKLGQLLKLSEQLTALESRQEEPQAKWAPPQGVGLNEIVAACEGRIAEISRWMEAAAEQEKTFLSFVEAFVTTNDDTGPHLLKSVEAVDFHEIGLELLRPPTNSDTNEAVTKLRGRTDVAALVLAHLLSLNGEEAAKFAKQGAKASVFKNDRTAIGKFLGFLNYGQLREMADHVPQFGPPIAELLFASAITHGRGEVLEYLDPLLDIVDLHPLCVGFYRASIDGFHRGQLGTPRSWFGLDDGVQSATDNVRTVELCRNDLLDFVMRQPGMAKTYHRMRVYARTKYLRPLENAIRARNVAEAMRLWESHGTMDDMVEDCAKAFDGPSQLDQTHYLQTRRYLSACEEKLRSWQLLTRQAQGLVRGGGPMRNAVSNLRREVDRGPHANLSCCSLLNLLEQMANGESNGNIVAQDFGERCVPELRVHADPGAKNSLVGPYMTRSWPAAVAQESVAIADLLHDVLREATRTNEWAAHELVHHYVQAGHVEAARRMGELKPEWAEAFGKEVETITASFRLKNADLLNEAGEAREADKDISDCLVEIENALTSARFGEADDWVDCLRGLVGDYRKRRDPVSKSLREFLAEAGQIVDEDTDQEKLRAMVARARIENSSRRVFIEALAGAGEEDSWPAGLRTRWTETATQIDKPRCWQEPERAAKLSDAILVFRTYISRKLKWRAKDPATIDTVVERLGEWVSSQLVEVLEKEATQRDEAIKPIFTLAQDVHDDCPSAHVLQVVGSGKPAQQTARPVQALVGDADTVTINEVVEGAKLVAEPATTSEQLVAELREETKRLLPSATSKMGGDTRALKAALVRKDWSKAGNLAAEWIEGHAGQLAKDSFNDTEAVCMLCIAGGGGEAQPDVRGDRIWLLGCLGLGAADVGYYLSPDAQEALAGAFFSKLTGSDKGEGSAASLLKMALEHLDDLPPTELKMLPVAELFRIGSQLAAGGGTSAAARVARIVWNGLRLEDNYKSRAGLIHLLFKLGQLKTIEALADTAKPHQQLVVNCIRAFAHAESNPEALAHGRQLRKALEMIGGLRPWQLVIKDLDRGQLTQDEAPVDCQLDSEFVTQLPGGRRVVELRLSPSLANPPRKLEIRLGGEDSKFGKVLLVDEPLYTEQVISLVVPPDFQPTEGGVARIPFEITGMTIFEKPIVKRGAWDVKFDDKPAVPIPNEDVIRAWPGASGNPVTRSRGFHGREKELATICAYVEATPRPRSVMVFGQRRIGKTSLAREAVTNFDLERDGIAAAFFDVSGLILPSDGSGMATHFFAYLVRQLGSTDNSHLRTWFGAAAQERLELRLRGLNPESSLLDCFDSMAQCLGEISRGKVQRFALVIDEFDRFVEPLLGGHREAVHQFLWNLRSVVQRAERVSLILAGSGLQKLLVQGYEDALFGSIDEIHVDPFTWSEDAEAVLETVFPSEIRPRLCRAQDAQKLAEQACELCGGHPMFLAFLGSAAAIISEGRRLGAETLNRVVERLVRDGVNEPCLQIDRKRFYNPTFQTLAALPVKTQSLAKLILVHVAERTTPEYPWESVANVMSMEALPHGVTRNDALEALKRLEEERVVTRDKNRSRVRITVPLTAAALRQEIVPLREEAIQSFESN
jgi:hypothetical protein